MAIEQYGFDDQSYVSGADNRTKQYYIVEETSTGTVTVANAATDRPVGVLQNKPNTNEAAQVRQTGITKCVSDGTTPIAIGDMRPLPDAQARFASLEAGESDLIWDDEYDSDNILKAQKNPALSVHTHAEYLSVSGGGNTTCP